MEEITEKGPTGHFSVTLRVPAGKGFESTVGKRSPLCSAHALCRSPRCNPDRL